MSAEHYADYDALIEKYEDRAANESARYVRASDVVEDLRYFRLSGSVKPDDCRCEWDAIPPNIACSLHQEPRVIPPEVTR